MINPMLASEDLLTYSFDEGYFRLVLPEFLRWKLGHFPGGTTSSASIVRLLFIFKRWVVPKEVSSDGGIHLECEEIKTFYRQWGITVHILSAHYPQPNGQSEVAVTLAKRLLRGKISPGGKLDTSRSRMQSCST